MLLRMLGTAAASLMACLAACFAATAALAGLGQPSDGQMGLQLPGSEVMIKIQEFYDLTNIIIIAIAAFVLILMIIVVVRFNERANPTPSRTAHHTLLEVAWTVIPIMILVVIAIPSFKLLNLQYSYPKPDLTIKAIGNAWFWDHEYVDGGFTVTSNMIDDETVLREKLGDEEFEKRFGSLEGTARTSSLHDASLPVWAERNQPRQLTVDTEIAVPVNKVVHVLVTSNDVIHQWAIQSFGAKSQAVPGRINALWFKPTVVGTFHGQCMVLCGKNHSAMPITIRVVPQETYDAWFEAMKAKDGKKAKALLQAAAGSESKAAVASLAAK